MRFGLLGAIALSVAGVTWIAAGPAPALEVKSDALAAARELVGETMTSAMVEQMVDGAWPAVEPQIRKSMPDASPRVMAGFRADYVRIVTEHTTILMAATPQIYAKYFTADELRGLIDFYRSPVGVKTLRVMPQVVGETVKMSTAQMPVVTEEINDAFREAMKAKGVELKI